MAQSRHPDRAEGCPLLGVKRTLQFDRAMSASDPSATLLEQACWAAQQCALDVIESSQS
jgi:hypothetical protein